MWICGLTEDDLHAALRQEGLTRLDEARLVLYEQAGGYTVVRNRCDGGLIDAALAQAVGPPASPAPEPGQHRGER